MLLGELTEPGRIGCGRAHVEACRLAIADGHTQLMIIENDAVWCHDTSPGHAQAAYSDLPDDWTVFSMGIYTGGLGDCGSKRLRRIKGSYSASHCYVVRGEGIERLLAWDGDTHVDRWMNMDGVLNGCYVTFPLATLQASGYSDNLHRVCDMAKFVRSRLPLHAPETKRRMAWRDEIKK